MASYALIEQLKIFFIPIEAYESKLEKNIFAKVSAGKIIFSALQTLGYFFVRQFVAPKLLGLNVQTSHFECEPV